jgi:hypothetical protein
MNRKKKVCTLDVNARLLVAGMAAGRPETLPVRERLSEACACLEQLEALRAAEADESLGKVLEDRIIWRELLELELQYIDEQIAMVLERAGDRESPRV